MRLLLTLCGLCLCFVSGVFGQTQTLNESYVAKAGDVYISEEEFTHRFELLPALRRQRPSQVQTAKMELLYSMIAEKLLAQEAGKYKLDEDPAIQGAVEEIRKLLARDELYRQEITLKSPVSDKEIVQGVIRAKKQLLVSYLFFEREEEARFVRSTLHKAENFERLELDSSMHAQRDTATVIWGEADEAVENAAYRLRPGQVSPVIAAGGGFYILKLAAEEGSPVFGSLQGDALTERVRKTIRLRKEKLRLDEYSREVLKDTPAYPIPRVMRRVAETLAAAGRSVSRDSLVQSSAEIVRIARGMLGASLEDSLVVVDTTVWRVGEVLDRLSFKTIPLLVQRPASIVGALNNEIRVWALRELMAHEALRRGMDKSPAVSRRLDMWRQYYLSEQLKERLRSPVSVSEAEVWAYLRALDTTVVAPQVQIRELRTGSLEEMGEALDDLQKGLSFEAVIRSRSNDSLARSSGGLTPYFPITARAPLGDIASRMAPGERYGPVTVPGGFLYFEVIGKRSAPTSGDSSLSRRFAEAQEEFLKKKQNRRVSLFLAQTGQERGFAVYEDRVRALNVTPIPMMTYRILGFGGRMFEVPFVEKQIDWLEIESPRTKILP